MRINHVLETFARGPKRGNARDPAREPFPFQAILPLKLKNTVSGKEEKTADAVCLQEMALMFACFKKKDFNQISCSQEIQNFNKCVVAYEEKKRLGNAQDKKGILTPGSRKLNHKQINQLLKKYPDD